MSAFHLPASTAGTAGTFTGARREAGTSHTDTGKCNRTGWPVPRRGDARQSPVANEAFRSVAEAISEEDLECEITSEEEVWEHVHPSEIFVSCRHRHERAIYVQITAECDWEPEHGLQIAYRRGSELSRVSERIDVPARGVLEQTAEGNPPSVWQ